MLQVSHGEVFVSETDTEVIPKLCSYVYSKLGTKLAFPKVRLACYLQRAATSRLQLVSRYI